MSFDTTSVNSARLNGVCTVLENAIGRELFMAFYGWLAVIML